MTTTTENDTDTQTPAATSTSDPNAETGTDNGTHGGSEDDLQSVRAELEATRAELLRVRVQARYGISDDDAALFLTGADETTLVAQAEAVAQLAQRRQGPIVASQGNHPTHVPDTADPVRGLLGR